MDLINNNINRDVQEECKQVVAGIYTPEIWMMRIVNVLQFIKLSPVNVMRRV